MDNLGIIVQYPKKKDVDTCKMYQILTIYCNGHDYVNK